MTRDIDDNPSGWSRSLPGHTVELDPGFASHGTRYLARVYLLVHILISLLTLMILTRSTS